jgi:hypothetical protein
MGERESSKVGALVASFVVLLFVLGGVGALLGVRYLRGSAHRAAASATAAAVAVSSAPFASTTTVLPATSVEAPLPEDPAPFVPIDPPTGSRFAELNARAIAALEALEFALAVELLEQCLAGEPEQPIFAGNLAEALARRAIDEHERTRPCPVCIEWMERAVELAPEREPYRKLLERWKKELEAESEFQRDRSVHFELSYDGWREQLLDAAPDVLDELERHYIDLALVFGLQPAERGRPRIPVVLYRREQFTDITGLADWAGGSYDGTIRVPMQEGRALDAALSALLRHELVHAFVREAGGGDVPAWLNEGLAQWLQRDARADLEHARRIAKEQPWIELERLQRGFAKLGAPALVETAYAQSLAFVVYIEEVHGRQALLEMVAGCTAGRSVARSFEDWSRITLATAIEDFRADLARR